MSESNLVKRDVTINLNPIQVAQYVDVSQYDEQYLLRVSIIDDSESLKAIDSSLASSTLTATLHGRKPSGFGYTVEALAEHGSGEVYQFLITSDMTNEAGDVPSEIVFTDSSSGQRVASANFVLRVQASPHADGTVDGNTEAEGLFYDIVRAIDYAESVSEVDIQVDGTSIKADATADIATTGSYDSTSNPVTTKSYVDTVNTKVDDIKNGTVGRLAGSPSTWTQNIYTSAGEAVRKQLDDMIWSVSKTKIGGSDGQGGYIEDDLNNYTTPGNYYINDTPDAAYISNYPDVPSKKACLIKVLSYRPPISAGAGYVESYTFPMQILIAWDASYAYARTQMNPAGSTQYPDGRWTAWQNMGWGADQISFLLDGGIRIIGTESAHVSMNDYTDYGNYYIKLDADINYIDDLPSSKAGLLKVENASGDPNASPWPMQTYREWDTGRSITRTRLGGSTSSRWSPWRTITYGTPENQAIDDIIGDRLVGSGGNATYTHQYFKGGIENPGFEIGIMTDMHEMSIEDVNAMVDFYINNPNVKMVLNLGDIPQSTGATMASGYVEKIYPRILAAGKGYAAVLGNHDVGGITGQDAINTFLNGNNNAILKGQPTGMGFVVDVDANGLVYANASNISTYKNVPDRVYVIEQTVRGEKTYFPIYLGCCYNIDLTNTPLANTPSRPSCMHTLDNSIGIFAKVCNFLKDKRHSPWVFAAHEIYSNGDGNWQKIKVDGIYASDDAAGVENRPSNFYVTQFTQGGSNNESWTYAGSNTNKKYRCFAKLLMMMEKGTNTGEINFSMPAIGTGSTAVPAHDFTFDVDNYSALNDVALFLCGHGHIDVEYAKAKGFDTDFADQSASWLFVTTSSTKPVIDYSDILFDYDDLYRKHTFTTLAVCSRAWSDDAPDTNDVTYIVQRFGAQNTVGGIPRKKLIYTRDKS